MFLFIQSLIIIICLSILSVYVANAKIGMPKRRKKGAALYRRGFKGHKDVVRDALDLHLGTDRRPSEYVSRYTAHA